MQFHKDYFHLKNRFTRNGLGEGEGGSFALPLVGGVTSLISAGVQFAAQQKAAAAGAKQASAALKAAKEQSKAAKIQATSQERIAQAQLEAAKVTPKWVWAAGIGAGVLVLGIGAYFLLRKKK